MTDGSKCAFWDLQQHFFFRKCVRRSHCCHEQWESGSDCADGSHAVVGRPVCWLCSSHHASARCCRRALYHPTVLGGDGGAAGATRRTLADPAVTAANVRLSSRCRRRRRHWFREESPRRPSKDSAALTHLALVWSQSKRVPQVVCPTRPKQPARRLQ